MSNEKVYNDGYQPIDKGYKPSADQPRAVDMPNERQPGAGYQPTSTGNNPVNPPKKP